jgi:hypothetical protein
MNKETFKKALENELTINFSIKTYKNAADWLAENKPDLFDKASELAENAQYRVSKYGHNSVVTCWHGLSGQIPYWKGNIYPKSVATVHFALMNWQ